jgi:hypothetical protein
MFPCEEIVDARTKVESGRRLAVAPINAKLRR